MSNKEHNNWRWEIKTKKQDNGLYGIPLQCSRIDRMPLNFGEDILLKHSAICIGIAEAYRDETFEIFWSDENGFFVKLNNSGFKRIRYKDYKLDDNILSWVG